MEFKDYQQQVLDTFDIYLDELAAQRVKAEKVKLANLHETDPDLIRPVPDFSKKAWEEMKVQGRLPASQQDMDYSRRTDGVGGSVPNLCFKVPTGGGKTLLASAAISRVFGRYLSSNTGFVLWIVPNEAIYTQTKKQLTNREHPYRQMIDRAAAGRVKFLEKNDRLDRRDVDTHLCVMLLMLQSANRETKETLRIFRDRGNVHGFFPPSDDFETHFTLLQQIPNLTAYGDQDRNNRGSIVQDSLGNVLRYIRPVVIMDEGHKAYSVKAHDTLYGFNPCFVLELTATPKTKKSGKEVIQPNLLVDVHGAELAREEMIKLPINLKVKSGDDWRDSLREGLELLNKLQVAAEKLQANTARHIRPIMLVQVERTGKDQRESGLIHSENAREFLLTAGLSDREIAIKTSEINDLNEPENQDLLSPTNTIRVIITKQALQEGWDCPFAYVLCSLSASSNMNAMTQLVGRILRQPHAAKTDVPLLDECYVVCHHAQTSEVVKGIKKGLEEDGMADLAKEIRESNDGGGAGAAKIRKIKRRHMFEQLEIFLPVVNWVEGSTARPLDYEQDVLLGLDWSAIKVDALAKKIPENAHLTRTQMTQITVSDGIGGDFFPTAPTKALQETTSFDPVYATRIISDIVPNPWVAHSLVGDLIHELKERGFDDAKLGAMSSFILEELRKHLVGERDKLAEQDFIANVAVERIQFRLRTDRHNWKMPQEIETELPKNSPQFVRDDGNGAEKSLFSPIYSADYNGDEKEFACYLDEQKALQWWHRNVAKAGQYYVQGWKKNKVYPDFIFSLMRKDGTQKMVVIETKGDQLEGSLDTKYKRKMLDLMSKNYRFANVMKAGRLELVVDAKKIVACDLVLMSEWKTRIPNEYFADGKALRS